MDTNLNLEFSSRLGTLTAITTSPVRCGRDNPPASLTLTTSQRPPT